MLAALLTSLWQAGFALSSSPFLPAGRGVCSGCPSSWAPADSRVGAGGHWSYPPHNNCLMGFTIKPTFSFSLPPLLHLKSASPHPLFNNLLSLLTHWFFLILKKRSGITYLILTDQDIPYLSGMINGKIKIKPFRVTYLKPNFGWQVEGGVKFTTLSWYLMHYMSILNHKNKLIKRNNIIMSFLK